MAPASDSTILGSDVGRVRVTRLLWGIGTLSILAALAAGWLFERSRERVRGLDAATRAYIDWIRSGDPRSSVALGAERRFAHALGVLPDAGERPSPGNAGARIRRTLAVRLAASRLAPTVDASALRLDDAAWRCDPASACTRRASQRLEQALRQLDRALASRRAQLHLAGTSLPLGGERPPALARPVPIHGSDLLATWLGTDAWGRLVRSRPPHVLDFPDGHHLALQARAGSIWASTWTDHTARRGPMRVADVPPVECRGNAPLASDRSPALCREVAITAMVATRGGRVAVKLLRTDVDFVAELLLASPDYGRSWQRGRPRAIR